MIIDDVDPIPQYDGDPIPQYDGAVDEKPSEFFIKQKNLYPFSFSAIWFCPWVSDLKFCKNGLKLQLINHSIVVIRF